VAIVPILIRAQRVLGHDIERKNVESVKIEKNKKKSIKSKEEEECEDGEEEEEGMIIR
jgi:hypothetical protein